MIKKISFGTILSLNFFDLKAIALLLVAESESIDSAECFLLQIAGIQMKRSLT